MKKRPVAVSKEGEIKLLALFRRLDEKNTEDVIDYIEFRFDKQRRELNNDELVFMESYRELTAKNKKMVNKYCADMNIKQKSSRKKCIKGCF
ncbi:hypothetical protein [Escherichia coli]|uniref:hypothetical protein n=1 Tax=Escherichia coli TaxID=562 RepID=UPI0002CAA284|nr:hypothetical protein [Escherichia coli]EMZ37089.1 hypothetical protein C827_04560 [Escherichia coli SWW33]